MKLRSFEQCSKKLISVELSNVTSHTFLSVVTLKMISTIKMPMQFHQHCNIYYSSDVGLTSMSRREYIDQHQSLQCYVTSRMELPWSFSLV